MTILDYLSYRKSDGTSARDAMMYPCLAGHGYACVRMDTRGTAEADGILLDEYLEQEKNDALETIAWIAAQPWCDGGVGMCDISWNGFNTLQVAARRPPALKAIITMCSTDDRYADDVHYAGGIGYDALPRASIMLNINAARPTHALWASDGWRAWRRHRPTSTPGLPIRRATPIGSMAKCARTTRIALARFTPSAAGSTATPMPSHDGWPACRGRTKA